MCIMKTIFTGIFIFVLFIVNVWGNIQKTDTTKSIEITTITRPTQVPRPKSLHPQPMITAYYNVEQKMVVVEFVTNQGVGVVELKDSMGNSIEKKTVDTSLHSSVELPLPTQPGEYTLLISTEILTVIGYLIL